MAKSPIKAAPDYAARRRRALRQARAAEESLWAILVTREQDVRYLTGFSGEDSFLLLPTRGKATLLTDGRYDEQARHECPGISIFVRRGAMSLAIGEVARELPTGSLGVQTDVMTIAFRDALAKALGPRRKIVPVGDSLAALRSVKDEHELALIRKAVRIAEGAFRSLVEEGRQFWIGRTERQIAAELEYRMRLAGAEKNSFPTSIAAGSNSSLPHYKAGDRRIGPDMGIVLDWGASYRGYCSDLTRVVFTGKIPPQMGRLYDIVLSAQKAAMSAVRSGVETSKVDAAAREVIAQAGFGGQFMHGTGHGLGLEVHEAPGVGHTSRQQLRAGMVITIEPGIYLPGDGGVRIEDDVLVTTKGFVRLSSLPRDKEAMVLR